MFRVVRVQRSVLAFGALLVLGVAGFLAVTSPSTWRALRGTTAPAPALAADIENGRRLFNAGGCASCHATPGQDDRTRLGGGLALHSPFGTFHVPNLSPHLRDGIGSWTIDQFLIAMREGLSPDGEHYYPSFPYTSYQMAGARDLADLFAFLRSLAPVEGKARDHDMAFPFNIRRSLGVWKLLYLDGRAFTPDPAKGSEWNRGAYLVEAFGHCAECHSPRDALGGLVAARRYAGGPDPEGKGHVPNITPHATGIGSWSKAEIAEMLKTGVTPNFDTVAGSMRSVVKNTAELSEADRQAMAAFLSGLPALESLKPARKN